MVFSYFCCLYVFSCFHYPLMDFIFRCVDATKRQYAFSSLDFREDSELGESEEKSLCL